MSPLGRRFTFFAWLSVMAGMILSPSTAFAAEEFDPADEFSLPPWVSIEVFGIDMSINKAVIYILIAAVLTTVVVTLIARKMKVRPESRTQTMVELAYGLMKDNITDSNLDPKMAAASDALNQSRTSLDAAMNAGKSSGSGDYTVRLIPERRDCLWRIAGYSEIYGDPFRWPEIYSANKQEIKDPDLIYPGQVFQIPR